MDSKDSGAKVFAVHCIRSSRFDYSIAQLYFLASERTMIQKYLKKRPHSQTSAFPRYRIRICSRKLNTSRSDLCVHCFSVVIPFIIYLSLLQLVLVLVVSMYSTAVFFSSHLEYGLSFRKFMRSLLRSNWHRLLHLDPILDMVIFDFLHKCFQFTQGYHRGLVCGLLVFWLQIPLIFLLCFITVVLIIFVSLWCFTY